MSTSPNVAMEVQQDPPLPKTSTPEEGEDKAKSQTIPDVLLDEFHRDAKPKRPPQILGVEIYKSQKDNVVTAIVRLKSQECALKAAQKFPKEKDWKWNKGFKAKITEMSTFWLWGDRSIHHWTTPFRFHTRYPELLGQRVNDKWDDLQPGCVVQLPTKESFKPKTSVFVDCTTFHNRTAETVFRNRPKKLREFIQIDCASGSQARRAEMKGCEGPTSPQGLLTFEGELSLPLGGYAGTTVYTTSLESLARLHLRGLEDVPRGYLKLYNLGLLAPENQECWR
ncbi:hypothetical protein IFR05_005181 [Cadophora sp. M221]|nr:hypothetical protein IFR05_005181 [Cadophora sp. M221]